MGAPSNCRYTFKLLMPADTKMFFANARPISYATGGTLAYGIKVKGQ